MSSQKRGGSTNAFSLLMNPKKAKKRRSSTGTSFVLCPAGCGKHIPEKDVNLHLDKCIVESETDKESKETRYEANEGPEAQERPSSQTSEPPTVRKASVDEKASATMMDKSSPRAKKLATEKVDQPRVTPESSETKGPNAFARMMEHSKNVFSSDKKPIQQFFYLDSDGTVSVRKVNDDSTVLAWSTTIKMKDKFSPDATPRGVEVQLCSAIPSHPAPSTTRLVRHHSQLSVPVLKSILQKSIRRRRPLPAVRVAMELVDKSLGELLRRLPIIILEDSTLHPDLPLLVWLMMAHSRDYIVPPRLIVRALRVIYETASCQWSDSLPSDVKAKDDESLMTHAVSFSLLDELLLSSALPNDAMSIVWSMLSRAEYGGMRGDMHMLQGYARLWKERLCSGAFPANVKSQFTADNTERETLQWSSIPTLIHRRSKEQSAERVTALCTSGIDRLTLEDITIAGIDFHCSSVIDHLLKDQQLVGVCIDLLLLSNEVEVPPAGRRSWLEGIFKSCMWKYSSGVNRRRPLVDRECDKSAQSSYSELWNQLVSPRAQEFQMKYIQHRLAN